MQTTDLAEKAAVHLPFCFYIALIIWAWLILMLMAVVGVVFILVGAVAWVRNKLR